MAEPIIQQIILDLRRAEQQLDTLGRQIANLDDTIVVPVQVEDSQLDQLQADLAGADETVNVTVEAPGAARAEQIFQELNAEIDETEDQLFAAQRRADALGDELQATGRQGTSAFGQLRQSIGPLVATFAAGFGIRELVSQFSQAVDSASALAESVNAVNVVFGTGADTILAFGRNAAQSVGLAASEFNQLAVPLGALLQNFGLEGQEAAEAAVELTTRAADLASVFNTEVTDALTAVGSALRGEQEPIRRFGVNLNQAAIDAKALELGLVGVGEEVDIAARGQAAYALILEQTAFAAGDFANTADTFANRQRQVNAAIEEARASLGEALLPVYEDLLNMVPEVISTLEDLVPVFGLLADAVLQAVQDVEPFIALLGEIGAVAGDLAGEEADAGFFTTARQQIEEFLGIDTQRLRDIAESLSGIIQELRTGVSDLQVDRLFQAIANGAEQGREPLDLLGEGFDLLNERADNAVQFLEGLADAAGASDQELLRFSQGLLLSRDALGLTVDEVAELRNILLSLGAGPGGGFGSGALVGFQNLGGGVEIARVALEDFRDSLGLTFDQLEASRALESLFGPDFLEGLPTVISDLDDLREAAAEAGGSLDDFVTNIPDDIVVNVDPALVAIGTLIEELEAVQTALLETTTAGRANIELPELEFDASGAVTNLDEVIQAIIDSAAADATLEANLSEIIVGADAVDLAGFIQTLEPEVAAALAQAFALDADAAADAQAALDGTMEGLAPEAATKLAETLRAATPQQIHELGVFAAENFVSNAIRRDLADSAGEIADELATLLGNETIRPEITIDLSAAQITGLTNLGQIDIGGGFGDTPGTGGGGRGGGGGVQPQANFEIVTNINNPEVRDLDTSASQAAQTIAAVSGSLERAL